MLPSPVFCCSRSSTQLHGCRCLLVRVPQQAGVGRVCASCWCAQSPRAAPAPPGNQSPSPANIAAPANTARIPHLNLTAPRRGLVTERLRRKRSYLAFCRTMPPLMLISSHRTHTTCWPLSSCLASTCSSRESHSACALSAGGRGRPGSTRRQWAVVPRRPAALAACPCPAGLAACPAHRPCPAQPAAHSRWPGGQAYGPCSPRPQSAHKKHAACQRSGGTWASKPLSPQRQAPASRPPCYPPCCHASAGDAGVQRFWEHARWPSGACRLQRAKRGLAARCPLSHGSQAPHLRHVAALPPMTRGLKRKVQGRAGAKCHAPATQSSPAGDPENKQRRLKLSPDAKFEVLRKACGC